MSSQKLKLKFSTFFQFLLFTKYFFVIFQISKDIQQDTKACQDSQDNLEDMDFQLNPNAAEFIPVSPSPMIPTRLMDIPISGSPLKQTPTMDDIRLPSPKEFQEEISHRPHEIEDSDNRVTSPNGDLITDNREAESPDTKQKYGFGLDESEASSTRAEFGDVSSASYLTTTGTDLYKTGCLDGSFTDSYGFESDPMITSFGPGTYNPLSQPVDLNAVHDLSDSDLCEANGNAPEEEVHEELVNLISPESDHPPHSAAFPEETEMLVSTSPVPAATEVQLKVDEVTSEVAAMNLKNEKLSEQSTIEVEKVEEKLGNPFLESASVCFTPEEQHQNSPSPGINSNSSEQCEITAEMASPKPSEVNLMFNDDEKYKVSPIPDVGIFQNPLNIDLTANITPETVMEPPEPEESDEIQFETDNEPVSAQFDPATGDPFSRSLSPTPEKQIVEDNIMEPLVVEPVVTAEPNLSMKLSESLQEFTGLEKELSPLANGDASHLEMFQEPQIKIPNEIIEEKITEPAIIEEKLEIPSLIVDNDAKPIEIVKENPELVVNPSVEVVAAAVKPKTAKITSKAAPKTSTTKSNVKSTPTSPTKATATRPTSSTGVKKAPTATGTRLKPSEPSTRTSITLNKSPSTRPAAAKPAGTARTTLAPSKPKPTATRLSPVAAEKKSSAPTTNGEAKPAPIKAPLKPRLSTVSSSLASKPLVKSTATTARPTTAPGTKSKPPTAPAVQKTNVKLSTGTVGASARPKTAPGTLGTTRNRVSTTAKSPVVDKQVKETANKQISSSRTATTNSTVTKTSRTISSTGTTTTTTSARRVPGAVPAKKTSSTMRIGAKSATAATKTGQKAVGIKGKVVQQNGVCEVKEAKVVAETIAVTTIETTTETIGNGEEILKKDSPVDSTTDNQLIITAD